MLTVIIMYQYGLKHHVSATLYIHVALENRDTQDVYVTHVALENRDTQVYLHFKFSCKYL